MDWTDFKLIGAITVGLIVSVLLSTANTLKARLISVSAGIFFALFLTEPLIQWAGLELSMWQYAVAGLLAMSGDRLARRIVSLVDTAKTPWEGGLK
nr:MAG TPA: hypothetical protein [Caudoviricetes sp.]